MRFFLALLLCGNLAHGAKVLPELNVPLPDLRVAPGASGSGIGVGPASPKATQSAQGGSPSRLGLREGVRVKA